MRYTVHVSILALNEAHRGRSPDCCQAIYRRCGFCVFCGLFYSIFSNRDVGLNSTFQTVASTRADARARSACADQKVVCEPLMVQVLPSIAEPALEHPVTLLVKIQLAPRAAHFPCVNVVGPQEALLNQQQALDHAWWLGTHRWWLLAHHWWVLAHQQRIHPHPAAHGLGHLVHLLVRRS